MGKVFIGMECSGVIRRAMASRGHDVISADYKPAEDVSTSHIVGDVFESLNMLAKERGWWPDLAIFQPTCTYLTYAAEWAFGDGPYHQKVKSETIVGRARWVKRHEAVTQCQKILNLPIKKMALENPRGYLTKAIRKPDQTIQPYQFGDDASKATCLHLVNLPRLTFTSFYPPRFVDGKPRWSNQTDMGQSRVGPQGGNEARAAERSRTYQGLADAIADQWGSLV